MHHEIPSALIWRNQPHRSDGGQKLQQFIRVILAYANADIAKFVTRGVLYDRSGTSIQGASPNDTKPSRSRSCLMSTSAPERPSALKKSERKLVPFSDHSRAENGRPKATPRSNRCRASHPSWPSGEPESRTGLKLEILGCGSQTLSFRTFCTLTGEHRRGRRVMVYSSSNCRHGVFTLSDTGPIWTIGRTRNILSLTISAIFRLFVVYQRGHGHTLSSAPWLRHIADQRILRFSFATQLR